ncbi:MAG TPA: DUF192 domain-containing protein [Dehalococcoidia bacterium]|nr:DUF192 domain-containing protein [Dehalococcoidia bacterium]
MRLFPVILVLLAALVVAACDGSSPIEERVATLAAGEDDGAEATLPTTELDYGGGTLIVEVARTPEERAVGLSGRDSLPEDRGMLFDLEQARVPSFWMKDTNFPLDMVWIGEDKRVAEITADVRPQPGAPDSELQRYSPGQPVRYVLELNGGAAERLRIEPGTQLEFSLD